MASLQLSVGSRLAALLKYRENSGRSQTFCRAGRDLVELHWHPKELELDLCEYFSYPPPVKNAAKVRGFSLVELAVTLAIMLLLTFVTLQTMMNGSVLRGQTQLQSALDTLAIAQRSYLVDNPTQTYSSITTTVLLPYLSGGAIPTIPSGATLNVSVYPPTGAWNGRSYVAAE